MSKQSLEDFRVRFIQNSDWQEKLKNITDKEQFICSAVELGQEKGFDFTAEEVEEALVSYAVTNVHKQLEHPKIFTY